MGNTKLNTMTRTTILFIQGGGEGAYEIDRELVVTLQQALGETYKIIYPQMPDETNPDYESWKDTIDNELRKIAGSVILIGHSIGSFLLLKYLLNNTIDKDLIGLFFISTPFVGARGWQYEGMAINPALYSTSLPAPVFFYHGTDDEMVPFAHLSLYEKKFPYATFRKIAGRGHQLNNDLSEVVDDIRGLIL